MCLLSNALYGGLVVMVVKIHALPPPWVKLYFFIFTIWRIGYSLLICCLKTIHFDRNFARNFTVFSLLASLHENETSVLLTVTVFIHVRITVRNIWTLLTVVKLLLVAGNSLLSFYLHYRLIEKNVNLTFNFSGMQEYVIYNTYTI